jgi:hypothetical protein
MRRGALAALGLISVVGVTVALLAASSEPRGTGASRCSRAGATTASRGSAVRTLIPPGNSSVSQYVENVPTAHGGCPISAIDTGLTMRSGRSGAISPATQAALLAAGPDGAATVALARATAPRGRGSGVSGLPVAGPSETASQTGTRARNRSSGTTAGSSPLQALGEAVGGASGGGGVGVLFPIVLALCLLGTAFVVLHRRRMD